MKVYINIRGVRNTGKGFFLERLSEALGRLGIVIVEDPSVLHDISLSAIYVTRTNAKKHILRLDGVIHNTLVDYKGVNNLILNNGVKKADAIVYQSNFAKRMCEKYLGEYQGKTKVIFNGAKIKHLNRQCPDGFSFLTAARWRPHKRLKDTIESFLFADIKESVLYVAGDLRKSGIDQDHKLFRNPKIQYLGVLSQKELDEYRKQVLGLLHLCWVDFCPNSVVEALAADVPVITNNVGGTQELVRPTGKYILPIDKEYDMEPCRLYEPPKIDQSLVASALVDCCYGGVPEVKNNHVDINNIALQYKKFFEEVLCE